MKYWFKRKAYGWGWKPTTWQAYLVITIWVFSLIFTFIQIDKNSHSVSDTLYSFVLPALTLTLIAWLIQYYKGEKPRWQWVNHK
ncbi:MAG: hypothetical protein Q7R87_00485 [Nanoarchaeota archaeon]|nr:hypothetical protein [Nanoarchaeota archaeon]